MVGAGCGRIVDRSLAKWQVIGLGRDFQLADVGPVDDFLGRLENLPYGFLPK